MKPIQQVFALVLEDIWKLTGKRMRATQYKEAVQSLRKQEHCDIKLREKIETLRNKEIKVLLFDEFLRKTTNTSNGNQSITLFYSVAK